MKSLTVTQKKWAGVAFFSLAGLVSSFWQLLDKLYLLKHPAGSLSCNLNSVFNCGQVLNSRQYEVFGFPNAMIGIIMFTFFLTMSVAGISGAKLTTRLTWVVEGVALFMLGFILWFLFESTYRIHAICLFCAIIGPSALTINALLLRLNIEHLPSGARLKSFVRRGGDLFVWVLLLISAIFAVLIEFK